MSIKKDKVEQYAAWIAYMKSIGEVAIVSFFNLLYQNSEQGYDALFIVFNNLQEPEYNRPYEVTNEDIYLAMCAFSDFHEKGDDFRYRWNRVVGGDGYASYVEVGTVKHVFTPFACHSIFNDWNLDQ